ncbi:FUSC family protein [Alkalihalobacillus sp. 1P02AB]|uniref:FUSC family protein n=1 Tax=Alkalihalobacillus sp. 1P02AB TaxID=3132260 RepID=UPI0039A44D35
MIKNWIKPLIGKRLLKTGLAVFITAWICQSLGLPVVFAVIAAIVTIEPTVHASIKKGMIRLPAAAIGAAIAMSFDFLLGQVPLTFALSAFFTIYICHRLGWHDAIIVSTLTAVAMIPMTQDHFFLTFLTRVATTTIGLTVSTLVNLIIWSPNFIKDIRQTQKELIFDTKALIDKSLANQNLTKKTTAKLQKQLKQIDEKMQQMKEYLTLQHDVHKFKKQEKDDIALQEIQKQVNMMYQVTSHTKNIIAYSKKENLQKREAAQLYQAWSLIKDSFYDETLRIHGENVQQVRNILYPLIYESKNDEVLVSKSTSIAIELLSIYHLLIDYQETRETQQKKQTNPKQPYPSPNP